MENQKILGVTGGIGAGKSIVCKVFSCLGLPTYNSDLAAKEIVNQNAELKEEIVVKFGSEAYADGVYNSKYIASQVFGDKAKIEALNALIHPKVKQDFELWRKKTDSRLVVKETALLFTTKLWQSVDYSLLVYAEESLRIKRIQKRDSYRSLEEIQKIMQLQGDQERWLEKADFVIKNDDKHSILIQVREILKKIAK